jgi:hypothetical protein
MVNKPCRLARESPKWRAAASRLRTFQFADHEPSTRVSRGERSVGGAVLDSHHATLNLFANVVNRDILLLEQAALVKRQDEEGNSSQPHPRQMVGLLLRVLLACAASLELKDCVLRNEAPANASADVVDR